jgi:biopolymer transport protein ExbD
MRFTVFRRPDPIIDVTPMIDVVFQLVLFFMVSTQFVQHPGIQVDLPRSSAQTVLAEANQLTIWMTSEGAVYVDQVPVSTKELRALLQQKARSDSKATVVLKADSGVSHGRVVSVMDLAHGLGLTNLAIATDPEAE